jgi:nucleotide-binding universal stress UspA family protein
MGTIPRSILVPTDFSANAEHALWFALRLARVFDAEVHLVHVRILLEGHRQTEELQRELELIEAQNDEHTMAALDRRAGVDDAVVHTHLVRGLSVSESLIEVARDLGCDLVVMGTHGRRGLRHLLLGSVAEEVLRTAEMKVITVRESADTDERSAGSILVPHDFSERSKKALDVARLWAQALDASVTLLHVVEPLVYPEFYAVDAMPEDVQQEVEERSWEALREVAAEHLDGIEHEVKVVSGRATEVILDQALADRCDLVVMATRGLSGIEHLLLGSVAEGVVRRSEVPVLTVRLPAV